MSSLSQLTQVNGFNAEHREARKLVLCFDGTGNMFSGTNADTNVVKLLAKLDRNDPNQFHYYQTGIGTYDVDATSVDKSFIGSFKSSIDQTLDQGFGAGFDAHVLAGYRFLMRYYDSGDKIYMFGFSRGAFTAKFLARMVNTVGLLCKGNEEMVPFAYRLYQRSLAGEIQEFKKKKKNDKKKAKKAAKRAARNGAVESESLIPELEDEHEEHEHEQEGHNELEAFSNTFCRKEQVDHCGHLEEQNIKVYFLGMWDCVSSVAVLEQKAPKPVNVAGTARYVRHAVAVDERRVKFKAALLAQDIRQAAHDDLHGGHDHNSEDIKEVWFPGCHGDVGGGWPAEKGNPFDSQEKQSFLQRIVGFWTTRKPKKDSQSLDKGPFQMSDIPLAWMIRELELVGEKDPGAAVKWRTDLLNKFKKRFHSKKLQALRGAIHDSLSFGYGTGFFTVLLWKFLERFPFITRWELENNEWKYVRFPLNGGNTRDIPPDAVLHESLLWRLRNDEGYHPTNNHGGNSAPCLKHNGNVPEVTLTDNQLESDPDHQTYKFSSHNHVG
ncbi:hypothetical protein B0T17DRAFT_491225 [Bombardia bombarda]|uniref:T6SS Phospholipase effector Tle1-like catalytic domain-containing protein n=1 Tax=Bombardia bombarda TaxID=252184 RepID=A0AA39X8Z7_9PEZI|nr:hypothetical protein B0T17DRAFT_491225 [Bombardia bombarda]